MTVFLFTNASRANDGEKINEFENSVAFQVGANGTAHDGDFEFAFFPIDVAYSRELYDNDLINVSTSSFYDYIDTDVEGMNFEYRLGQKVEVGFEIGKYTPYVTAGFATIKRAYDHQTTPVYGSGILYRMSKRLLFVNELNFQPIKHQDDHYEVVNFTTGVAYIF